MATKLNTYDGNCHCGLVRYTATLPESLYTIEVTSCNCSICLRNGLLSVYPLREDVIFHSGRDQLKEYRFGTKTIPHYFCPNCGSSIMIDFRELTDEPETQPRMAMNVRHFRDVEIEKLNVKPFDGQRLEPRYETWIDGAGGEKSSC
jgi:hypothetical protein